LVAAPIAITVATWSALLANHWAYPLTLLACILLGTVLVASSLWTRSAPRPGRVRTGLRWAGAFAAVGFAALLWWDKPLVAEPVALDALNSDDQVAVAQSRSDIVFTPEGETRAGLVLYPGARVDPRAYASQARAIAEAGFDVVIVKCPFDLALLCPAAADEYQTWDKPWVVGGHSLGGVEAGDDISRDLGFDGLLLWASYPRKDLSDRTQVDVASVYGSADPIATPEKIDANRPLLPPESTYTRIAGGIHSFFGDYGLQPGDGEPTTDRGTAQAEIVAASVRLLEQLIADAG
jgi:hypothetical protein